MPQLATLEHETFARAVASGCSFTEAAKRAGRKVGAPNYGSRLMEQPQIAQRVIELQADPLESGGGSAKGISRAAPSQNVLVYVEKPWVVSELVSLHRFARRKKDLAASNTALKTLAQIGGLLTPPPSGGSLSGDPARVALLGIKEIHAMLSSVVGSAPRSARTALLAESPELAEIIEAIPESPALTDESTPEPGV